jgi:hypothetical protein
MKDSFRKRPEIIKYMINNNDEKRVGEKEEYRDETSTRENERITNEFKNRTHHIATK